MAGYDEMPLATALELAETVDDERLQAALRVIRAHELDEIDEKYDLTSSKSDYAERVANLGASFLDRDTFSPGQLVVWKANLKNRRRPSYNKPAVVIEVLAEPVRFDAKPDDGSFAEQLDLRLGFLIDEDRFVVFHFDSRRFAAYAQTEH